MSWAAWVDSGWIMPLHPNPVPEGRDESRPRLVTHRTAAAAEG